MQTPSLGHSIVFVSDMERSLQFYRDVLGFQVRFESPDWTEFITGEVTFALHLAPSTDVSIPDSSAASCQIGLMVDDLDQFHSHLSEHDVDCLQEPQREDFGGRLARYRDPDGLPFSVSERPN